MKYFQMLKGHKLSLVSNFCYGLSVSLYCTSDVFMNFGRLQTNPTVRVFQYSHRKNLFCSNKKITE